MSLLEVEKTVSAAPSQVYLIPRLFSLLGRVQWRQAALPIATLAMIVYFSIASPYFFDVANFQNIGRQGAALAAVAFGQTFVVIAAGIDLSVGSTVGLVSVVTAITSIRYGVPAGIAAGIAAGAIVGLVNGTVVAALRVAPFVATLAMLSAAAGAALIVSGGVPVTGIPLGLPAIATARVLGVPMPDVIAAALLVIAFVVLRSTRTGRNLYAIGGNAEASRLAGINIGFVTITAYVLCSAFTAIGAVILTARVYSGQPTLGAELTLESLAAVVLGGVSLFGGRGSVIGVAFGAIFITVLGNGLNLLNVPSYSQQLLIGAALVAAVAFDRFIGRHEGRRT